MNLWLVFGGGADAKIRVSLKFSAQIPWNREEVLQFFGGERYRWTPQDAESNILAHHVADYNPRAQDVRPKIHHGQTVPKELTDGEF